MASIWLRRPPAPTAGARPQPSHAAPQSPVWSCPREGTQLVAFIRHVGCPFAEQTVREARAWADRHPDVSVFIVSHGQPDVTAQWLNAIGGSGRVQWVQDPTREVYARWGLEESSFWHFGGPASLLGVMRLWSRGIRNRMASGTRWQRAGMFLVEQGIVTWCDVPASAQCVRWPDDLIRHNVAAGP